mgnify:CR=1 FL=1
MELQRFELGEGGLDTGRARDTLGNTIRSRSQIVVKFYVEILRVIADIFW